MQHYEIIFMAHPNRSEEVPQMIDRYKKMVKKHSGTIHRLEDWGRRQLAYPIDKIHKAHYVLMNIEANNELLNEIAGTFKFNDSIIRNLIIKQDRAIKDPSPMVKKTEKKYSDRKANKTKTETEKEKS